MLHDPPKPLHHIPIQRQTALVNLRLQHRKTSNSQRINLSTNHTKQTRQSSTWRSSKTESSTLPCSASLMKSAKISATRTTISSNSKHHHHHHSINNNHAAGKSLHYTLNIRSNSEMRRDTCIKLGATGHAITLAMEQLLVVASNDTLHIGGLGDIEWWRDHNLGSISSPWRSANVELET